MAAVGGSVATQAVRSDLERVGRRVAIPRKIADLLLVRRVVVAELIHEIAREQRVIVVGPHHLKLLSGRLARVDQIRVIDVLPERQSTDCIADRSTGGIDEVVSELVRAPSPVCVLADDEQRQRIVERDVDVQARSRVLVLEVLATEFSHSDSSVKLEFEAFQPNGAALPDYVKFNTADGTFEFDANAAKAANATNVQIRVVASDPDGNSVSTTFEVSFDKNAPVVEEAGENEAANSEGKAGNSASAGDQTGTRAGENAQGTLGGQNPGVLDEDGRSAVDAAVLEEERDTNERSDEIEVGESDGGDVIEGGSATRGSTETDSDQARGASDNQTASKGAGERQGVAYIEDDEGPIKLVAALEDQTVKNGILRYSILESFRHTDPGAVLKLSAFLTSGEALPDFVEFDAENGEFIIDADKAKELGIDEIAVRVDAEDDKGNQVTATFVIHFSETEAKSQDAQESEENEVDDQEGEDELTNSLLLKGLESVVLRSDYDADLVEFMKSINENDQSSENADFGKVSLRDQILRAGEFGYQQQKLQLQQLLDKLFG